MAQDVSNLVGQLFEIDAQRQVAAEAQSKQLVSNALSQQEVVGRASELAFRTNEVDKQVAATSTGVQRQVAGTLGGDTKRIEVANAVRGLMDSQLKEIGEAEAARAKWEETRNAGWQPMDYVRKLLGGDTSAELAKIKLNNEIEDVRLVTQNIQNLDNTFASAYNTAKNTAQISDYVIDANERVNAARFNIANDTAQLNADKNRITISQELQTGLSNLNKDGLNNRQKLVQDVYTAESLAEQRRLTQENRRLTAAQRVESLTNSKVNSVAKAYGSHFSAVEDLGEHAIASGAMDSLPQYKAVSNEYTRVASERAAMEVELTLGKLSPEKAAERQVEVEKLKTQEAEVATRLREQQAIMDNKIANGQRAKIQADATLQAKTLDQFNKVRLHLADPLATSFRQADAVLNNDRNLTSLVDNYNDANPSSIFKSVGLAGYLAKLDDLQADFGGKITNLLPPELKRFTVAARQLSAHYDAVVAPTMNGTAAQIKQAKLGYVDRAVERAQLNMLSTDTPIPGVGELFKLSSEDFLVRGDASPLAKEYGHYLRALNEPANQDNMKDFFVSKYYDNIKGIPAKDFSKLAPKFASDLASEFSGLLGDITATKNMGLYELGILSSVEFTKPMVATGRVTVNSPLATRQIYDLSNPNELIKYLKTADESFMDKLKGRGLYLLPSTLPTNEE